MSAPGSTRRRRGHQTVKAPNGLGDVRRRLWLFQGVLLAFLGAVTLFVTYWVAWAGPAILERADNPRLVIAELSILRGRLLDANESVLASTTVNEEGNRRYYPLANIGPAVGYYNFRYGSAGVEESFDAVLSGKDRPFWDRYWNQEVLHRPLSGRDVRLTIDSRWQLLADELMGERPGALVLISLADGAIRAMVSHPLYDPNQLEDSFDALAADERAPLLNRVTQGQYQPGLALQPLFLATALEAGLAEADALLANAEAEVQVNGLTLRCAAGMEEGDSAEIGWTDVLARTCPAPTAMIGRSLGEQGVRSSLSDFGLLLQPEIAIASSPVEAPTAIDPEKMALGQGDFLVSPLQVVVAWGALMNGGMPPSLRLVNAVQRDDGSWQRLPDGEQLPSAIDPGVAAQVTGLLPMEGGVLEHAALVAAGPDAAMNAWYLAAAPASNPRYVLAMVIENADGVSFGREAGRLLLKRVLDPQGS